MTKKRILLLTLLLTLFGSGCSNMNETLSSISGVVETGINNFSSLFPNSSKSIDMGTIKSKYFEIENYKFSYINNHTGVKGIEASFLIDFNKKIEKDMFLKIEFPVYNSNGKLVTNGLIAQFIYPKGPSRLIEDYGQLQYNERLFIKPEEIVTKVYLNKKLIYSGKGIQGKKK